MVSIKCNCVYVGVNGHSAMIGKCCVLGDDVVNGSYSIGLVEKAENVLNVPVISCLSGIGDITPLHVVP